jgi:hypothetical protein
MWGACLMCVVTCDTSMDDITSFIDRLKQRTSTLNELLSIHLALPSAAASYTNLQIIQRSATDTLHGIGTVR